MKKKVLSCLILLGLSINTLSVFADSLSVSREETLIQGVTYRHEQFIAENGWQDVHIVTADLSQDHLKLQILGSEKGKSYLENTFTSAEKSGAIAAVNADFFQTTKESGRGSAIGLEIANGEIRTSPAAYEQMNVLYSLKKGGKLLFDSFQYEFLLTAPDKETAPVTVINKYDGMTGIVMYTPQWGSETPGSAGNVIEVLVEEGKVTAINRDAGPVPIPENGYVLACDVSMNTFLLDHIAPGDNIELSLKTNPDYETVETAVGGGGMLIVDGQVQQTYSHTISGTHPRTAVGVDKTGTLLTLVVVDGRRTGACGMTMAQLGTYLQSLGCYNAMNLDGGGSSLMALDVKGEHQVVNTPSDKVNRPVTNSIGIVTQTNKAKYASLALKADQAVLFAGTSTLLTAEKYDQYDRFMENAPIDEVSFTLTQGSGSIKDGFFYPSKSGKAVIKAKYGKYTDEITFEVLEEPHRMIFVSEKNTLKENQSKVLWLRGFDENGRSALIYPKDVQTAVETPAVAKIEKNTLQALKTGSSVIRASFGKTVAYGTVTVGNATAVSAPDNVVVKDPQNVSPAPGNTDFTFTVFGNTRTPETLFDLFMMNGVVGTMRKDGDLNFVIGNDVDTDTVQGLGEKLRTADAYSVFTKDKSTFITLKNAYGVTLFSQDSSQLANLQKQIDTFTGDNLFIFVNDHNLSYYEAEVTVFKNLMKKAAEKAKNVYVFGGGFVNECVLEDGVRYITTAGVFPSIGFAPPSTNISYLKYYTVSVQGDTVTYETKGILQ